MSLNPYISLAGAIVAEIIATTALNVSDGFSNLLPGVVVVVGYGVSFYLLSLSLKTLPVGVIYATWTAFGITAIAAIGVVLFDEPVDVAGAIGIGLILVGVYLLNAVSKISVQ